MPIKQRFFGIAPLDEVGSEQKLYRAESVFRELSNGEGIVQIGSKITRRRLELWPKMFAKIPKTCTCRLSCFPESCLAALLLLHPLFVSQLDLHYKGSRNVATKRMVESSTKTKISKFMQQTSFCKYVGFFIDIKTSRGLSIGGFFLCAVSSK